MRSKDGKLDLLRQLPPFSRCTRSQIKLLGPLTDIIEIDAGAVLMKEGNFGSEFFVIVSGEAVVLIRNEELASLGPGDMVGEMALLDRQSRSATVRAISPMKLVVIGKPAFDPVLETLPGFAWEVLATLVHRLRRNQAAA